MRKQTRRDFLAGVSAGGLWIVSGCGTVPREKFTGRVWPSAPPAAAPLQASLDIAGLGFTGLHAAYTKADTWYPSWAEDGNLYSPFTDGEVYGVKSSSAGEGATTGQAKIEGDDPLELRVTPLGVQAASPLPYGGRYPCGSLVHDGIWYYGTYCLDDLSGACGNWCVQGPFVGFRTSLDFGKTWTETPRTPARNLFGETAKGGAKVKMGAPHFVDFGRNMEHSPDGKAYLVAHGAVRPEAKHTWISGDQIYLVRVKPSLESINDASKYEFFAGHDGRGRAVWSRDFGAIRPLFTWDGRCGCVTATYNPVLKKYLMCVTHGWPTVVTFDTMILEADSITGPWRLVTFMERFGGQAYFVNFPSKFIRGDGRTLWLCYSANFSLGHKGVRWKVDPPGSRYALCLQEVRLLP